MLCARLRACLFLIVNTETLRTFFVRGKRKFRFTDNAKCFTQLAPVHQDRYLSQHIAHVRAAVLRPDRDNVARHRPTVWSLQVAGAHRDHLPVFHVPYYV